jgi:hypothetical protein
MTQSSDLVNDLRLALPQLKGNFLSESLIPQFDNKLVSLLSSLLKLRTVSTKTNKNPIEIRNAMTIVSSDLEETKNIYQKIIRKNSLFYPFRNQGFSTAFESFDQKANQLFNLLSTAVKNQKEVEGAITKNIL